MARMTIESELRNVLDRIQEAAKDGQDGSAAYRLDRLKLIEKLTIVGFKRLRAMADTNG